MKQSLERVHRINYVTAKLDALYHKAAKALGLADSTMFALYTLYDRGGSCSLAEINAAGICKQTANSAMRRLEAEGVIRLEAQGGKAKKVILTERGKALAERTVARLFEAEAAVLALWSDEELESYTRLGQRYVEGFQEKLASLSGEKTPPLVANNERNDEEKK